VLCTGVTGDLKARVYQHREKLLPGFTNRDNVSKLVYFEAGYDPSSAIAREKQIKTGSRRKKIDFINRLNPEWRDLYGELQRGSRFACAPGERARSSRWKTGPGKP
jgi:putative endonuclease